MRKSIPLVASIALMVVLSACDTSPAAPTAIPTSAPTSTTVAVATTAPTVGATATSQTTSGGVATGTATGGSKSSLNSGKVGIPSLAVPTRTTKGATATHSVSSAREAAGFESGLGARSTPTAAAEPTESSNSNSNASSAVPDGWSVVVDNDFSGGDVGTWLQGEVEDVSAGAGNGTYDMTVKNGAALYSWSDETTGWDNALISATVTIKGPGYAGVTARLGGESGSLSNIVCMYSNAGVTACYKELNGKDSLLLKTNSSAIKKNGANSLALLGNGTNFSYSINGKLIKAWAENDITEGTWGTYAETGPNSTTVASYSRIVMMGDAGDVTTEGTPTVEDQATEAPTEEATEVATEVPTEEATQEATEAPTQGTNATPGKTATAGNSGSVIYSSDFASGAGTWAVGEGDGFSAKVTGGALVLEQQNPGGLVVDAPEETFSIGDARIEATVKLTDASKSTPGLAGIMARSQAMGDQPDWRSIICGITAQGNYGCLKLSADLSSATSLLKGQSAAIKKNGNNTLTLRGQGNRWTFEINGQKMGSFTDNSVTKGAWGVFVIAGDGTTSASYSQVTVYKP